jgi:hypothetical protein
MWLCTRRGFYSVVESHDGSGNIQIRARDKSHLENLHLALPSAPILETPKSDYPYRMIVSRDEAVEAITLLASEIDYVNFKDMIDHEHGRRSWFSSACHDVWGVFWDHSIPCRPTQCVSKE